MVFIGAELIADGGNPVSVVVADLTGFLIAVCNPGFDVPVAGVRE